MSISGILKKAPAQYARAYLFTETDESDVTYFLIHQLETIVAAMDGLHAYLRRKAGETKVVDDMLQDSARLRERLNHRQLALIRHALRHPISVYTIAWHRRNHAVVYQTARSDLLQLVELGLLSKRKTGQAFLFEAPADLKHRLEEAEFNLRRSTEVR
ncbi:hypothetical protein [Thiocapsa sp.]|uniref:hypothetical protein n=1 Tax=Thiocapsa sp. TaxID=2024551 RepID=UPI00262EE3D8|nr:hypothetical protein [Thiocapsa sp.]